MYAHTRIRSILRRSGVSEREAAAGVIRIAEPAERALALEVLEFPATIEKTGKTLQPHRVCGNLYAIATAFMIFYERCPVLRAEEPTRASRLALCALTARTLARGLDLLGIAAPEQL
jgi:arginyl-tRNA synthetase